MPQFRAASTTVGACASEALRLVLRRGLLLVLAGTAIGVASARGAPRASSP
ncbi:MAG: hypothetical protein ACRELV_10195 [Longimicrobiales bacterium]